MADARYFAFTQPACKEFVFQLTDANLIQKALDILSGKEAKAVHVAGRIAKKKASYNSNWSYYLDPGTISFFELVGETYNADIQYVEDHLSEACGAFLPGCYWTPATSKLTREVKL
jgi:hypothetical protein